MNLTRIRGDEAVKMRSAVLRAAVAGVTVLMIVGVVTSNGTPRDRPLEWSQDREFQQLDVVAVSHGGSVGPGAERLPREMLMELTESEVQEILSSSREVVEYSQAEFAEEASEQDYAHAVRAYEEMRAEFEQIIAVEGAVGLSDRFPEDEGSVATAASLGLGEARSAEAADRQCMTVHKWQLQAIAWIAIHFGVFMSVASLFVGGATVLGLPAGAVIAAVGTALQRSAGFFLWAVNSLPWTSRTVCF